MSSDNDALHFRNHTSSTADYAVISSNGTTFSTDVTIVGKLKVNSSETVTGDLTVNGSIQANGGITVSSSPTISQIGFILRKPQTTLATNVVRGKFYAQQSYLYSQSFDILILAGDPTLVVRSSYKGVFLATLTLYINSTNLNTCMCRMGFTVGTDPNSITKITTPTNAFSPSYTTFFLQGGNQFSGVTNLDTGLDAYTFTYVLNNNDNTWLMNGSTGFFSFVVFSQSSNIGDFYLNETSSRIG